MWDFSISRGLGLMARTWPFVAFRMVVYFGIAVAYVVATGAGAGVAGAGAAAAGVVGTALAGAALFAGRVGTSAGALCAGAPPGMPVAGAWLEGTVTRPITPPPLSALLPLLPI